MKKVGKKTRGSSEDYSEDFEWKISEDYGGRFLKIMVEDFGRLRWKISEDYGGRFLKIMVEDLGRLWWKISEDYGGRFLKIICRHVERSPVCGWQGNIQDVLCDSYTYFPTLLYAPKSRGQAPKHRGATIRLILSRFVFIRHWQNRWATIDGL